MSIWVEIVIIVLALETLRIGLSCYVIRQVLRGVEPLAPVVPKVVRPTAWFGERDRLASQAMDALRRSMDENTDAKGGAASAAIDALDAYILHHQEPSGG